MLCNDDPLQICTHVNLYIYCLLDTCILLIYYIYSCDDVYAACDKLEKAGVTFKKKPDEGR
jgi:hypothetical protein